jgi:hypothetical protein
MSGDDTYEFYIDAFTPASIPMSRLAEYMAGLALLLSRIESIAENKVHRLDEVRFGTAPKAAKDAFRQIDEKLAADNAVGLDGEVIQAGGRDETIDIHIKAGDHIHRCITTKAIARQLAQHIFGAPVRVGGTGTWSRAESGRWKLHRFDIESFQTLDDTPLSKLFEGLRARLTPLESGRLNPAEIVRQLREER